MTTRLILGGIFFPSPGGAFYDEEAPGFALWQNVSLGSDDKDAAWWLRAMLIEFLGGTLFLEVIANCACTKKDGPNQYYAMAIGFVLTPCVYFMIPISGACINPSIGFAINFFYAVQTGQNIAGIFAFTLIGYTASFGAALIFSLGRADEFEDEKEGPLLFRFKAGQWGKLFVGEFLGVFWIIFTVGIGIMNPLYKEEPWTPWGMLLPLVVGLYLTAQVYSHLGTSGSCINPAISLCVHLCRPDVIPGNQLWKYQVMKYAGAFTGWLFVGIFYPDVFEVIQLKPNEVTFFWGLAFIIEATMTMMFLEHIANCALSPKDCPNQYYALAIGESLAAGVVVMAPISGACINPSIGERDQPSVHAFRMQSRWRLHRIGLRLLDPLHDRSLHWRCARGGPLYHGPCWRVRGTEGVADVAGKVKPRIWFNAGQWGQLLVGEFLGVCFIVMIIGVTIASGNIFTAIYVGCKDHQKSVEKMGKAMNTVKPEVHDTVQTTFLHQVAKMPAMDPHSKKAHPVLLGAGRGRARCGEPRDVQPPEDERHRVQVPKHHGHVREALEQAREEARGLHKAAAPANRGAQSGVQGD